MTAHRALVEQAARGDRGAFDVLVDESIDRLYATARLILRDVDLAEDAVQEALVRCWQGLPRLRSVDRFDGWLHRLLINAAIDEHRSRRRFRATVPLILVEPASIDPSTAIAERELVARAFERLRIDHRVVLVLQHYLDMSTNDMAEALGVPRGTVKSRIHYATEAMRAALDADARQGASEEVAG